MHKDEIKGKVKEVGGMIEEDYGKLTGDREAEADGVVKQVEGKGEQFVGKVKGKVHDVID